MKRPNILLLYTDQQRWDTIQAAGFNQIKTPNLDSLAKSGTLFTQSFCNSPVCMPSRQSMLTGQYPIALGSGCNGIEMPVDTPNIATYLKPYGYHTANIGKLHFKNHSNRDHREAHPSYGFDTLILSDEPGCYDDAYIKWVEEMAPEEVDNCRCSSPPSCVGPKINKQARGTHEPYIFDGPEHLTHTAFVADQTSEYIKQHKDEPFFAIAGFYAPHCPLNPPKRFVDMYDPTKLDLPIMNDGEDKYGLSDAEWQAVKQYYYALITHVDDQIGNILKTLDDLNLREDTIIIFTSDHGEHLGDHGIIHKGTPGLDSCTHVPLIVSGPGHFKAQAFRDEPIEAIDIVPSILDWAGIQQPPILPGRSFRPLLEGKKYKTRTSTYLEHRYPFGDSWKSVRTKTAKYCISNQGDELLFDLENDPHELTNIIEKAEAKDLLSLMRQELLCRVFDAERQYPERTGDY